MYQFTNFLLYSCIHSYHSSGDEKALEQCENEISICQRKKMNSLKNGTTCRRQLNQLREQLANAEVIYNINILDNMQLLFY